MKFWTGDDCLDVVVLGPMGDVAEDAGAKAGSSNCEVIRDVTLAVLAEPEIVALMAENGFTSSRVTCPQLFRGHDIRTNAFTAIDKADIALVDISPRPRERSTSPNVMYELGLVHALGLPYLLIQKNKAMTPFYLSQLKRVVLPTANYPNAVRLAAELRQEFQSMLRADDKAAYETNPVSQYYDNAAVVDVSAVMGLATGYYFNFLYRLLKDPNFLRNDKELRIDRQITLVPNSLRSSALRDIKAFEKLVEDAGLKAEKFTMEIPQGKPDDIRDLTNRRIGRVGFDIPTTAYALRRSPRYSSLAARTPGQTNAALTRMEHGMLKRFSMAIDYLLQRGQTLEDLDLELHSIARLPTTVDEVRRLFAPSS